MSERETVGAAFAQTDREAGRRGRRWPRGRF